MSRSEGLFRIHSEGELLPVSKNELLRIFAILAFISSVLELVWAITSPAFQQPFFASYGIMLFAVVVLFSTTELSERVYLLLLLVDMIVHALFFRWLGIESARAFRMLMCILYLAAGVGCWRQSTKLLSRNPREQR
jgi:nicotinamide riboside transporter PnuC